MAEETQQLSNKEAVDAKSLEQKPETSPVISMSEDEKTVSEYVQRRSDEMKDWRKSLGVETEWREADAEYLPAENTPGGKRKRFEQDQDTGYRSRMVEVSDDKDSWRSKNSDPMLLNKIQTAISIILDQNPEATLVAYGKKFEKRTKLAYAIWKRNWGITKAKEIYKLFVFDLFKYGWAVGRSYPTIIKYPKKVLDELDTEDASKNKYVEKDLVWFNDVMRQRLDPYKTWISEQTKPYQPWTMNDCYYEIDFEWDLAASVMSRYPNFEKYLKNDGTNQMVYDEKTEANPDESDQLQKRKDIVTFGFYESRLRDLFVISVPSKGHLVIHSSPLPNDDGYLSLWHAPCVLRSADSPFGIGIWKIIKQDKRLYDKMTNLTMDQLVLSIMKMFFYTGTGNLLGDGQIKIEPGKGEQIINGKIDWLDVPGPGTEAWDGLKYLKDKLDDNSAIPPVIEGMVTGKTLGEILHAKEAALKKLKTPLDNIADAMAEDAYVTLSWTKQILSTPELKEFATVSEMKEYEKEMGIEHNGDVYAKGPEDEEGNLVGEPTSFAATFLPEVALHLSDRDGELYESKDSKYFQIGKDIKTEDLDWRGVFRVIPGSILSPSAEIEKQRKTEMFNVLVPLLQGPPELFLKPVTQLLKVNDEDPEDWLPDSWIAAMETADPLFVPSAPPPPQMVPGMPPGPGQPPGGGQPLMVPGGPPGNGGNPASMQKQTGVAPLPPMPTVAPPQQVGSNPGGGVPGVNVDQRQEMTRMTT